MTPNEPTLNNSSQSDSDELPIKFPIDPKDLYKHLDRQTNLIIGIFSIAIITMLCMVGGLLIDAFHFNSATYREYSEKIDTLNQLQITNKSLQEQIQTNENAILQQNTQILNILNTK